MATNRNDDMDRNKKNSPTGLTPSHTSPSGKATSRDSMGQKDRDAVERDREMNRDSSGSTGEVSRDNFGSIPSRDRDRGPSDISE